jgi:hypothetical protein
MWLERVVGWPRAVLVRLMGVAVSGLPGALFTGWVI